MPKITEMIEEMAEPIAARHGCSIYDTEYVREGGTWYLRVYIDKNTGVTIDDCEAVSRELSDLLDEKDPIPGSYTLEVSSPGADRILRKPEHFQQNIGKKIDVRLYRLQDGRKQFSGKLIAYENGDVTISWLDGERTFAKKDIAQVRLFLEF